MIRSMTGFGKASAKGPQGTFTVELKTLNNKSLSISCTPYDGLFHMEEDVKAVLEKKLYRGKVFVRVDRESSPKEKRAQKIELNEDAAKEYMKKIRAMQKKLGIGGEIQIRDIISLPGILQIGGERKEEDAWPTIKQALEKALNCLMVYRQAEGKRLAKDFKERLDLISKAIKDIRKYEKESVTGQRAKLTKSMGEISGNPAMDKKRMEEEVAIFARNCDVAEEMTRLLGHIEAYRETIGKAVHDVGKKLDFIAQEMHRETNTIGSKASDFRISNAVIEIKSEIDRLREQIKNIE